MSYLCVPITSSDLPSIQADLAAAQSSGADMVELRLDYMQDIEPAKLAEHCNMPVIWTLRHASQGGKWHGSSSQHLEILQQLTRHCSSVQYIDLEYRIWQADQALPKGITELIDQLSHTGKQVKLILSHHDFKAMPNDLPKLADQIAREPAADIVKVVGFANHICDNFVVLDLLANTTKPTIALAMGPAGQISRILAPKLGAFLTFASLAADKQSAPGQLTAGQMINTYRWKAIGPQTRILGVIGSPVAHSLSPAIHNAALAQCGIDAVYLPFLVDGGRQQFSDFLDGLLARPWLGFTGTSVTIPHKANALQFLQAKSATVQGLAEKIGAINTILVNPDRTLAGCNTDYQAILDSLAQVAALDRPALASMPAAVLGAGGVSRAIVAGLTDCNADVTIYNRTAAKAQALAQQFACKWRPWEDRLNLQAQLVINGTSIGMHPREDQSPLPSQCLSDGMVVFDTVYNPAQTKLLELAAQHNCRCIDGLTMFVAQAAGQFKLWTEKSPPRQLMRKVVLQALAQQ